MSMGQAVTVVIAHKLAWHVFKLLLSQGFDHNDHIYVSQSNKIFEIFKPVFYCFWREGQFYTGWPKNNGTVDTADLQDFALIYSYVLYFVG